MYIVAIDPESIGVIKRSSKRFFLRYRAASNKTLIEYTKFAKQKILANITRRDFTQAEFNALDNPYAKKHGRIKTGKLGFPYNANQPYLIQKGSSTSKDPRLRKDLKIVKDKSKGIAEISFDNNSGHTDYVIKGTKKMFARDVISGTMNQKGVRKKLFQMARKNFKAVIKSYGN